MSGYLYVGIENEQKATLRARRFPLENIDELAEVGPEALRVMGNMVERLGVTLDQRPGEKSALELLTEIEEKPLFDYISARLGIT